MPPNRYLLAIGTASYDDRDLPALPGVPAEIAAVRDALVTHCGYTPVTLAALEAGHFNPTAVGLQAALCGWFADPARRPDDIVVVYLTGHGLSVDAGQFYYCPRDTEMRDLPGTAVPAAEIATWCLSTRRPQHLLLIFDTCYAGQGAESAITQALAHYKHGADGGERTVAVLAAATHKDVAHQGLFATAFAQELAQPTALSA